MQNSKICALNNYIGECPITIFVSTINPKLIKDFDNDSLRKVKSDKADAVKIARYALDK